MRTLQWSDKKGEKTEKQMQEFSLITPQEDKIRVLIGP